MIEVFESLTTIFSMMDTITNAISKNYLQAAQNGFQFSYIVTYIHPLFPDDARIFTK